MIGITKADGSPYYHVDFLVDEIMKMTPEKKEENKAYWIKDGNKPGGNAAAPGGDMGGSPMGDMGGGDMGGAPDMSGGDMGGEYISGGEAPPAEGGNTPPAPPTGGGEGGGSEFEF